VFVTLHWTLRRLGGAWSLWSATDLDARTAISIPADIAWRIWTKGMTPDEAQAKIQVRGDETMAWPMMSFVAIMA
jgi:hypothetical protein